MAAPGVQLFSEGYTSPGLPGPWVSLSPSLSPSVVPKLWRFPVSLEHTAAHDSASARNEEGQTADGVSSAGGVLAPNFTALIKLE